MYTNKEKIKLNNVLYISSLKHNLMLIGTLVDKGNMVVFVKDKCFVLNNLRNKLVIRSGNRNSSNDLYKWWYCIWWKHCNNSWCNETVTLQIWALKLLRPTKSICQTESDWIMRNKFDQDCLSQVSSWMSKEKEFSY